LEDLGPSEGVNRLLSRYPVYELESGTACLGPDLDTPEDYGRGGH
jgi:hypothetical protein